MLDADRAKRMARGAGQAKEDHKKKSKVKVLFMHLLV